MLVALCAAAVSALPAALLSRPVAVAVPRAVSGYSSGVTHAVALQEHTVARPLALTYVTDVRQRRDADGADTLCMDGRLGCRNKVIFWHFRNEMYLK